MSKASLENFLNTLKLELERDKGAYRSLTADIRPHFYRFRVGDLVTETVKQFQKKEIPITDEEKEEFRKLAIRMKDALSNKLSDVKGLGNYKETPLTIEARFLSSTDTDEILTPNQKASKYRNINSVFSKIREVYRGPLEQYFSDVQNFMRTQSMINEKTGRSQSKVLRTNSQREKQGIRHVFDSGHVGEAGIIQSKVADAFNAAEFAIYDEGGGGAALKKDLETMGIKLSIMRDDSTDSHSIQIESASRNRAAGARMKHKKKKLQAQIEKAIKRLEGKTGPALSKLKGSDTLQQKKRKESIDKVMNPLMDLKKPKSGSIKVTKEDTKRKKSSKAPAKTVKKPKAKSTGRRKYGVRAQAKGQAVSRISAQPGPASNPLFLLQEINRRLPAVIVENMGDPALVNQTGRFAASVRVVDILKTAKGFPSIGYTYMRAPYQTFEVGGKQGSQQLDPRNLINKSIREIAAELAMGRLFTRRV